MKEYNNVAQAPVTVPPTRALDRNKRACAPTGLHLYLLSKQTTNVKNLHFTQFTHTYFIYKHIFKYIRTQFDITTLLFYLFNLTYQVINNYVPSRTICQLR